MVFFILKRAGLLVITMLFVITLTFFLMNTVPGGPFLSEKALTPETIAALKAKYGLDKPLPVQLVKYIAGIAHGDFGVSLKMQRNRPVISIIFDMFPVSLKIGVIALLWSCLAGIAAGCAAAYKRGSVLDSAIQVVTTLGIAFPSFVTATVLLVVFAGGVLNILPSIGLTAGAASYILPCFTLGLGPMCAVARYTRSSMLDVLGQDYIRTARAYGISTHKIIFKYALRNAVIPVMTFLGPLTASIITGGFVVETVFNIPGLGRYFVQSITNRDYPIIMGTTVFLASIVIIMSFLVDVLYRIVDPRIRDEDQGE